MLSQSQQTILLTRIDDLQVDYTYLDSSRLNPEELSTDCPDCFDTMVKVHESDKIRYHCENCDLVIPEIEVQEFIG
jgi:hypothetical protein